MLKTILIAGAMVALAGAQERVVQIERTTGGPLPRMEWSTFANAEFAPTGKTVKGAPYQADAVTETVQVLADGNRITRKSSTAVARDSEGRTRRDITLPDGALGITVIHDPVANVSYTLEHGTKTARKMRGNAVMFHMQHDVPAHRGASSTSSSSQTVVIEKRAETINFRGPDGPGGPAHDIVIEGGPTAVHIRRMSDKADGKSESLGKQTIDGVTAEGTRTVNTIAAGEIGNERPIEIVFERWYSPELQTLLMSRHKDPMAGETTFKLQNLRRNEPLKSLFEPPADYTVKEGPSVSLPSRKPEKD